LQIAIQDAAEQAANLVCMNAIGELQLSDILKNSKNLEVKFPSLKIPELNLVCIIDDISDPITIVICK
jgi:hypothetical protein